MFDGLRTIGKWILIIAGVLIIMGALIGYHQVGAALGDLLHHIGVTIHTARNHAKNG